MMRKHATKARGAFAARQAPFYPCAGWLALLAMLGSAACSDGASGSVSRLEVVIDADDGLRADIDRIELEGDANTLSFDISSSGEAGSKAFPFTVPLVVDDSKTRGSLQVRAFAGKVERVRRSVDLRLAKGKARLLAVYLTSSCVDLFKTCDAQNEGTCLPCQTSCSNENIDAAELPVVSGPKEALSMAHFPTCRDGMGEGGMGGGEMNDAGPDASTEGGSTNGDVPDARVDPDAMLPEGGSGPLTLTIPAVVAAPGCVAVTVAREDATSAAGLALSAGAFGAFYVDDSCTTPFSKTKAFAAGVAQLEVYFAPALSNDHYVDSASVSAKVGTDQVDSAVEVRARARQVMRGLDFACMQLVADGSVHCMGSNSDNQMGFDGTEEHLAPTNSTKLASLGAFSKLSAYYRTSCALILDDASDSEGSVQCWGRNDYGQLGRNGDPGGPPESRVSSSPTPTGVLGLGNNVVQLSAGVYHACAVTSDDKLFCWGNNASKVIKDSATPMMLTATEVTILADSGETSPVVEVASGWDVTCARVQNGKVYCWGKGVPDFGVTPKQVTALPGAATHIAVGADQSCATVGSELYCWNGSSTVATRLSITNLPGAAAIDGLQLNFNTGCVVAKGDLYCWGANPEGWLGTGTKINRLETARRVALPGAVESFAIGGFKDTQLTAVVDGLAYSWGDALGANVASLGIDAGLGEYPLPTRNPALDDAASVMLSPFPGCTISASGGLACWAHGTEVGNGTFEVVDGAFASKPLAVAGLSALVTQVEGGDGWTFALWNGNARAFGYNGFGQLGTNSRSISASPVAITLPGTAVLDVAAAGYRACALVQKAANAREVLCWGAFPDPNALDGEVGDALLSPTSVLTGDDALTDVDVTGSRACALNNGAVSCWSERDDKTFAIAPHPASELGSGVVSLEMHDGEGNTLCVRKSDNSAWCGFFGATPTLTFHDVQSVSAGAGHACAKQTAAAGAKLLCAGHNSRGQLGNGAMSDALNGSGSVTGLLGEVTAYSAGGQGTCAKDSEGWKCWGSNRRNGLALSEIAVTKPTIVVPWSNP